MGADDARRQRTLALFGEGHALAEDDGNDLALALEAGRQIPPTRLSEFLESLSTAKRLIVAEGLLLRALRRWLPKVRAISLGEHQSCRGVVRVRRRAGHEGPAQDAVLLEAVAQLEAEQAVEVDRPPHGGDVRVRRQRVDRHRRILAQRTT